MLVELHPHLGWSTSSIEDVEQRGKPSGADYIADSLLPFAVPPGHFQTKCSLRTRSKIGSNLSLLMFYTMAIQGPNVYVVNIFFFSNNVMIRFVKLSNASNQKIVNQEIA